MTPHLGRGTSYESWGKQLEVPLPLFDTVCRWENIRQLRTPRALEELRSIRSGAQSRERVDRLYRVVTEDLGLALLSAVEEAKCRLSNESTTDILFAPPGARGMGIEQELSEAELQQIIGDETDQVIACLEEALQTAGVADEQVDVCFMTGGSSQVQMLRDYFDARFGREAVQQGDAFVSVASGLLHEAVLQAERIG